MACGPSVGVPGGKCLFSDSEALPLAGEPRAVFRVYFQYWQYHSMVCREGVAALPALLCLGASARVWPLHQQMFQEPTVTSDPVPSLIAASFRAHAEIQR